MAVPFTMSSPSMSMDLGVEEHAVTFKGSMTAESIGELTTSDSDCESAGTEDMLLTPPRTKHSSLSPSSPHTSASSDCTRTSRESSVESSAERARARESPDSSAFFSAGLQALRMSTCLFFFDWDDTLCPSTWISHTCPTRPAARGESPWAEAPEFSRHCLADLDDAAVRCLRRALALGKVVIVTNARHGWVPLSAERFLPQVAALLEQEKIPVVYARDSRSASERAAVLGVTDTASVMAQTAGGRPVQALQLWKETAMETFLKDTLPARTCLDADCDLVPLELFSIGDQMYEHLALAAVARRQSRPARVKILHMGTHPSVPMLARQLQIIERSLSQVVHHADDLHVEVHKSVLAGDTMLLARHSELDDLMDD